MRMASGNFFTWLRRRGRATRGEPRSHGRCTDDGRARRARRDARAQASKRRRPGGTDSGGAQTHAARHEQRRCAGTHTRTAVVHMRTPSGTNSGGWRTDAHRAARTAAVHRRTSGGLDSGGALAHTGAGGTDSAGAQAHTGWHGWCPGTHQGGTHSGGAHVHGRQLTSRAVVPYAAGCPALCREQVAVTQAALVAVVVRDAVGRAPLALAAAGAEAATAKTSCAHFWATRKFPKGESISRSRRCFGSFRGRNAYFGWNFPQEEAAPGAEMGPKWTVPGLESTFRGHFGGRNVSFPCFGTRNGPEMDRKKNPKERTRNGPC